jgi:hypothetical protein
MNYCVLNCELLGSCFYSNNVKFNCKNVKYNCKNAKFPPSGVVGPKIMERPYEAKAFSFQQKKCLLVWPTTYIFLQLQTLNKFHQISSFSYDDY